MSVSKVYNAIVEYNPISLSIEGIKFISEQKSLQAKIGAVFFTILPSILAYFASRFAAAALPSFLAILSPLECAAVTFTVTFIALSISFGLMSKGPIQQATV